ncbi:PAS domain-containing protein [Mucilaginibacter panaciglaebae]|uniref:histidine kinase n=1 Tax=Mucilaginibacter panaciglaebae TaxID=502331 RepID=A0ABP7WYG7_9SPHI
MSTSSPNIDLTLLANAVAATNTSFIIADHTAPDHPIIFCNEAFEQLTGYPREEVLGKNCRFLQGDDRDQTELERLRDAVRCGQSVTVTLRNYRKDGSPFRNELNISPVHGPDGAITHLIGIQRLAASVLPPLEDQFHHEWRTPLAIIKGTLQILRQKGHTIDPNFLNKSLGAAVKAIDRLENLGLDVKEKNA